MTEKGSLSAACSASEVLELQLSHSLFSLWGLVARKIDLARTNPDRLKPVLLKSPMLSSSDETYATPPHIDYFTARMADDRAAGSASRAARRGRTRRHATAHRSEER